MKGHKYRGVGGGKPHIIQHRTARKAPHELSGDGLACLKRAIALGEARNWSASEEAARKALEYDKKNPTSLGVLAQALIGRAEFKEAIACLDLALEAAPGNFALREVRALACVQGGEPKKAKQEAEELLVSHPRSVIALKVIGMGYLDEKKYKNAEEALLRAAEIAPMDAEALYLVGKLFLYSERGEKAKEYLKRSIKLNPRSAIPFFLMGSVYRDQCRFQTSYTYYRYAHKLDSDGLATNVNLGLGLFEIGRVHEAIEVFKAYFQKHPDAAEAQFNLAIALLLLGQLDEGWRHYEARKVTHKLDKGLPFPVWQGESLAGKTLLIVAEQGVGDEIWAASMFEEVIEEADRVVIECEPRLVTLFQRSFPTASILPRQPFQLVMPADVTVDYQCLMLGIARWRRNHPSKFPGPVGYLKPEASRRDFWHWRLKQLGAGLKIGITWRSGLLKGTRKASYTSLDEWGEIFTIPGAIFINLQYGECQAELDAAAEKFGVQIHNFKDIDLKDGFEDVAALISSLDVVVAPANAVACLSSALNIPLLQFVPNNYWVSLGEDYSPWFPSVKLFFRPWDREWAEALLGIGNELKRLSRYKASQPVVEGDAEESQRVLEQRLGRGIILMRSRQSAKAQAIFEEMLALAPRNAEARFMLGLCRQMEADDEAATSEYAQAIEIEPLYAEVYNQLGSIWLKQERIDEAREAFEKALELKPNYPDALNNLGNSFAAAGNVQRALDCYQRVIAAFSGHNTARYNLAAVLDEMGRLDEAETEYRTVLDAIPSSVDVLNNLGVVLGRLRRNEEAIQTYRDAIALNGKFNRARINLAKKLISLQQHVGEAAEQLRMVFDEEKDDPAIANLLGAALAMSGKTDEAKTAFIAAIDIAPTELDGYRNLATLFQQQGYLEEAKAVLAEGIMKSKSSE
jgi:tetratricopeptide (TPR) repeat protein